MTELVALLGRGQLRQGVDAALGGRARAVEDLSEGITDECAALVVASDADDRRPYPRLRRYAQTRGLPWLPVRVEVDRVLVGPVLLPDRPGCLACLRHRREHNRTDGEALKSLHRHHGTDLAETASPLVTPLLAGVVGALVRDEVDHVLANRAVARTEGALLSMSLHSGAVTRELVLPHPLCPYCSALPEDTRDGAAIRIRPRPKLDPSSWRVAALQPRRDELERLYLDPETGVIGSVGSAPVTSGVVATARLDPGRDADDSRHGYGHAADHRSASLAAIAEALERLAGGYPRGRNTTVHAPYAQVAEQAVDPRALGLYPDRWYDQPGFRFARFRPDRPINWVWGYSFARAEPVLIPRTFAYYGSGTSDDPGLAYECSNGCALGGCLEEAILHGLLEVAERDAFLMTWYTGMVLPRVDLDSAQVRRIPMVAELIRQRHGYRVVAFDATLEQRIPAFWVMAVDLNPHPDRPRAIHAAGAHPDPEQALCSALGELASTVSKQLSHYRPELAAGMLADPDLVREMADHAMLHGHPDAFAYLAFLDPDQPAQPLVDEWPRYSDLGQDLAEALGRYLATGLDVLAVDTTSPEHRVGGFACAKVLVPGTLSMTFGHRYRRCHDLPRLHTVPGLLARPAGTRLNPFPHPFP
jgi:ribosomal protein S12 methylthiotransferase accessory factor